MQIKDLLNIVKIHLSFIIKATISVTILLFILLLFVYPVTYKSEVTILPPESNSQSPFGALLGQTDFSDILTGGMKNASSQLFMEILKSRNASLYVTKKLNLKSFFNESSDLKAAEKLRENLNLELTKEGIVKLNVKVSSGWLPVFFAKTNELKALSAKISNSYVEALDNINKEKLSSKAKRAGKYIEDQLLNSKTRLDSAENQLTLFQKENKTIALPEQVKASIESATQLRTEIVKTEIELRLAEENLTNDNKALQSLRDKLSNLNKQYNNLESGSQGYLLAFKDVPEIGKKLAELTREVKVQNEVYTMLQQQFYKEKIQENRDLPTVEVLDEAIPPLKQSEPRPVYSAVMGGIFTFLLISLFFVVVESKKNKEEKIV